MSGEFSAPAVFISWRCRIFIMMNRFFTFNLFCFSFLCPELGARGTHFMLLTLWSFNSLFYGAQLFMLLLQTFKVLTCGKEPTDSSWLSIILGCKGGEGNAKATPAGITKPSVWQSIRRLYWETIFHLIGNRLDRGMKLLGVKKKRT